MTLLIGVPSMQREATLEERDDLIYEMRKRYPDRTEAECFDMLSAMTSTDRYRMLIGRFDDDAGDPGSDYDGLDAMEFSQSDNLGPIEPPPAVAPIMSSRPRKPWYDR
jgi:hypothetical protein